MPLLSPVGEWVIRNWKELRAIDQAREDTAGELIKFTKAACDRLAAFPDGKGVKVNADARRTSVWRDRWYDDDGRGFFIQAREISPDAILDSDTARPVLAIRWEGEIGKADLARIESFVSRLPDKYEREPLEITTVKRTTVCARKLTELNAENLLDGSAAEKLASALMDALRDIEKALAAK